MNINKYDYQQTYELMRKFYELNAIEVRIIDYLMSEEPMEITYSQLTEAIGFDKRSAISNVRKAVIRLEKLKIVCIIYKDVKENFVAHNRPMRACFLVDEWMDNLLQIDLNEIGKLK